MTSAQSTKHLSSAYCAPVTVLGSGNTRLNGIFPLRKRGKLVDINCTKVNAVKETCEHTGEAHPGNSWRVSKEVKSDLSLGA